MTSHLAWVAVCVGLSAMGAERKAATHLAAPEPELDAPWSKATKEQQEKARALFDRANSTLHLSLMQQAVELYQQALKHWDHPAIHYNLAMALLGLSQVLECHQHLEAAIQYGPEPLTGLAKYQSAQNIKFSIEAQLAKLELSCEEPEASVSVDERKNLFICPRSYEEWVRPGIHIVEARKPGFFPTTKNLTLKEGETLPLRLNLYTEAQWTQVRTPWQEWVPWAVFGAGAAVAATGGGLHLVAANRFLVYDQRIEDCSSAVENGRAPCAPEEPVKQLRDQGSLLQGTALGFYAVGGVAVVAGGVLLLLNAPRSYRIDPELRAAITPVLAPGSGGVVLTVDF